MTTLEVSSGPEGDGKPQVEAVVGQRIRQFRTEKGLSLRAVAALTGLSIGFLSQVERGLCSISLTSLRDLAASLGRPMSDFFSHDAPDEAEEDQVHFTLTRAADTPRDSFIASQRTYQMLSDRAPGLVLEPMLVHIAPGGDVEDVYGHRGEEFAFVLSGELLYTVESTTHRLQSGDSIHLRSNAPHRIHNDTAAVTTVVSVVTPRLY